MTGWRRTIVHCVICGVDVGECPDPEQAHGLLEIHLKASHTQQEPAFTRCESCGAEFYGPDHRRRAAQHVREHDRPSPPMRRDPLEAENERLHIELAKANQACEVLRNMVRAAVGMVQRRPVDTIQSETPREAGDE